MVLFNTQPIALNFLLRKLPKMKRMLVRRGGRNYSGKITVYHRGGGNKVCYRFVDFWREFDIPAIVISIVKDPLRTGFLALVLYVNGVVAYILAPEFLGIGNLVFSGIEWVRNNLALSSEKITTTTGLPYGSCLPLALCPLGLEVCNIELAPTVGGQLCRAAGTKAIVVKKSGEFVTIKVKSGWCLVLSKHCKVTLGVMSNSKHKFDIKRKAGYSRNKGIRPTVRGVAMNPIDHPHGGGQGKTSGGKKPLSPWGKITKGRATATMKKRKALRFLRYRE